MGGFWRERGIRRKSDLGGWPDDLVVRGIHVELEAQAWSWNWFASIRLLLK